MKGPVSLLLLTSDHNLPDCSTALRRLNPFLCESRHLICGLNLHQHPPSSANAARSSYSGEQSHPRNSYEALPRATAPRSKVTFQPCSSSLAEHSRRHAAAYGTVTTPRGSILVLATQADTGKVGSKGDWGDSPPKRSPESPQYKISASNFWPSLTTHIYTGRNWGGCSHLL